tara:strand:- start:17410 stop:19863 length:2454 start_codon:yes stop_codon:yes gene_type:complete
MASANIARLGVVLAMDTAEFTASVNKAIAENQKLAATIKRQSNAAEAEIIRLKHATDDYGKTLTQVELAQRQINSGSFMLASDRHKKELLAQAAALDLVGKSTKTASAGMNAFQKQSLMYQTTDFFTQIASGQSVMIAAIQQGGQLKDTMGGLGPMFKMLATIFTPFRIAMGGIATVLGVVAFAAYKGREEFVRLRDDLILTGNFAGITQGKFELLAKGISGNMVASIGDAKNVLSQLVASGNFIGDTFSSVGNAILHFAKVSGLSSDEAAKRLIPSLNGTASGAKSLNDQYHFLTMAQYLQIEALERHGKKQEAIILTADALKKSLSGTGVELGVLQKAWKFVGETASSAWAAMMNLGKPITVEARLAGYTAIMLGAMKDLALRPNDINAKAQFAKASEMYQKLIEERDAEDKAAAEKSVAALKTQTEIEQRAKAGGFAKEQANIQLLAKIKLDTELAAAKEFASEVGIIDLDANRAIETAKAEFKKKQIDENGYYTKTNQTILNNQIAQIEQDRLRKTNKFKTDLMISEYEEQNALTDEALGYYYKSLDKHQAAQIASDAKSKLNVRDFEYDKERIALQSKMIGATDRELKQAMLQLDLKRQLRELEAAPFLSQEQHDRDEANIRAKASMDSLIIDAQDKFTRVKEMTDSIFGNMGTAIDNFVKTGKLNFKDFARSVIQDLIAIQLKAQAVALMKMAFSNVGGSSGGLGGMISAGMSALGFGGPKAAGGSVTNTNMYMVGENGPEMFVPSSGGTIIPNGALSAMGGGGQTINYNGPFIQSMSAIDTQSGLQFLAKNKQSVWSAYQSANRGIPMSR